MLPSRGATLVNLARLKNSEKELNCDPEPAETQLKNYFDIESMPMDVIGVNLIENESSITTEISTRAGKRVFSSKRHFFILGQLLQNACLKKCY